MELSQIRFVTGNVNRMSDTVFTQDEQFAIQQCRVWPRLLAFPVLALVGHVAFLAGASGESWQAQSIWIVVLSYCWFCIGGVLHELSHQTLPISKPASVWLGRIIGTVLGQPYSVFRAIHIRHHAYLNTPLDFELWPYCDPRRGLWFRRFFVWFDIFCGAIATPLIYQRVLSSRESPVTQAERRHMKIEYCCVLAFWMTVIGTLASLEVADVIHLTATDFLRISPPFIAASLNSFRKLTEHLGMSTYDPVDGTRTIIGRHWWTRFLSYFDFELSIHGPHHRYPKRSHQQLESTMRELERLRTDRQYPVFDSIHSAVLDVLPWMFKNPGVGINAGNHAPLTHLPNIDHYVTDALRDVVASQDD
jgi:fatty acid desaturase